VAKQIKDAGRPMKGAHIQCVTETADRGRRYAQRHARHPDARV